MSPIAQLVWNMKWIFLLLTISSTAVAQSCYFPDGSLSTDTPCNSTTSTGHSACCSAPCMTSGLCFDHGLVSRGSCTDPTWKDASCPQYCTTYNPAGGSPIVPRAWTTDTSVSTMGWCCDFPLANGSCSQGFEITVQAGTVVSNTTVTSSSNGSALVTGTGSRNRTCSSHSRAEAAIGVGIGLPALIAVASLAFLWLRERQLRRKEDGVAAAPLKSRFGAEGMELMSGAEGGLGKPEMDGTPHRGELP